MNLFLRAPCPVPPPAFPHAAPALTLLLGSSRPPFLQRVRSTRQDALPCPLLLPSEKQRVHHTLPSNGELWCFHFWLQTRFPSKCQKYFSSEKSFTFKMSMTLLKTGNVSWEGKGVNVCFKFYIRWKGGTSACIMSHLQPQAPSVWMDQDHRFALSLGWAEPSEGEWQGELRLLLLASL